MVKFSSILALVALSFVSFTPSAEALYGEFWRARTDSGHYGVHPYEPRTAEHYIRTHSYADRYLYPDLYFYAHPDRSVTHGLHPFNRELYYEPPYTRFDTRRYLRNSVAPYSVLNAYYPRINQNAQCQNHTYWQGNYRVSPYGFRCQ